MASLKHGNGSCQYWGIAGDSYPHNPENSRRLCYERFAPHFLRSEKWDVPNPSDSSRFSDDPYMVSICSDLIRRAPDELNPLMKRTFVGNVGGYGLDVSASLNYGYPQILLAIPLEPMIRAMGGAWEASLTQLRFKKTGLYDPPGVVVEKLQGVDLDFRMVTHDPEVWLRVAGIIAAQTGHWSAANDDPIHFQVRDAFVFAKKLLRVLEDHESSWQSERRARRERCSYAWILGHEYAHLLLGHTSDGSGGQPESSSSVSAAADYLSTFLGPSGIEELSEIETHYGRSPREELEADALGLRFGVFNQIQTEGSHALAETQVAFEGVAVALLAIARASPTGIHSNTEHHPATLLRLQRAQQIFRRFRHSIGTVEYDEEGPFGPGFLNRLESTFEFLGEHLTRNITSYEIDNDGPSTRSAAYS